MTQDIDSACDPELVSLVLLLCFHGVSADTGQIGHRLGVVGIPEMLHCTRELGLRARAVASEWPRLVKTTLPAIGQRSDGGFFILGRLVDDTVLVQDPRSGRPQSLSRPEFEAIWSGRLVVMTRRAGLSDLARRFDVTWFLQAMHKYRGMLVEVFVASFFLQIFSLITPLFFQVVIDKVLVHRGLTTLDVLVAGLIVVSVFESALGALRTSARVSLDRTQMRVEDRHVNLAPGMALTVEIRTAQRRVIEYLLSPLLRYRYDAIRER